MLNSTRLIVAIFVLAFSGLLVAEEKSNPKFDAKNLIGKWSYTAGKRDGSKVDQDRFKEQSVEITKDKLTLKGEQTFVMKYVIDEKKKPMAIKLTITDSPFGAGAMAEGVIELKGDELTLCYAPMGGDAPTDFNAKEGSGFHLFSLKREPEKVDIKKMVGDWVYVSGERGGNNHDADHYKGQSISITKEAFTLKGEAEFVMKFKLDADKKPAAIDFTISEGPFGEGSKSEGIIQINGEQLTVCYAAMGGKRPEKFTGKDGSENHLFVLKKRKKD